MFKNTYQSGLLTIFYSCGSNPLAIWDMEVQNGHIKRLTDSEVNSIVLEIVSTNVATTYITCPKRNQVLGIRLPFLVMIVKNLKRYFSFEITILDDKNMRRRFRISNFQSTTKIKPFCTTMPIGLSGGWNQIQFNLADFTKRAYGTQFQETLRVQVHANARLRRIYFCERLYNEEELPQDYKLYLPLEHKQKKVTSNKNIGKQPPVSDAPPPPPTPPDQTKEADLKIKSSKEEISQDTSDHVLPSQVTDVKVEEPPSVKEEPVVIEEKEAEEETISNADPIEDETNEEAIENNINETEEPKAEESSI